jgi:hypothetical protein
VTLCIFNFVFVKQILETKVRYPYLLNPSFIWDIRRSIVYNGLNFNLIKIRSLHSRPFFLCRCCHIATKQKLGRGKWGVLLVFPIILIELWPLYSTKNSLKITKGNQAVNWKTDNTMTKRKKDKQRSTKHYTENLRLSNTNPTRNQGWTQAFR